MNMRVAIGCDHRGIDLKTQLIKHIEATGNTAVDLGTFSTDAVDYPDIAKIVGKSVVNKENDMGMLICDTGIGMSISANKVNGVRAALCHDEFTAMRARLHNNANVMCVGAHNNADEYAKMVKLFLTTQYEGGRHQKRLDKISDMEGC